LADAPPPKTGSLPAAGVDAPSDAELRSRPAKPPKGPAVPPEEDILDLVSARGEKGPGASSARMNAEVEEFAHLVEEDVLEDAGPPKPVDSAVNLGMPSPRLGIDLDSSPLISQGNEDELLLAQSSGPTPREPADPSPARARHDGEDPVEILSDMAEEEDPLVAGAEPSGTTPRVQDSEPSIILTPDDLAGTGSSIDILAEGHVDLGSQPSGSETESGVDLGSKEPSIILTPADLVGSGSSANTPRSDLESVDLSESDILEDVSSQSGLHRAVDVTAADVVEEYTGDIPEELVIGGETGSDQPRGDLAEGAVDDSLVTQDSSFELLTSDLIVESPTGGTSVSGLDLGAHPGSESGHELLEASAGSLAPGHASGMDLGQELTAPRDQDSSLNLGAPDSGTPSGSGKKPKIKEGSGIDLLAADVMEDLPPLDVPDLPSSGGGRSGVNLQDEDILLQAGGDSGATPRADSSRDLIAESLESGIDLVGSATGEGKKKKLEDLDAFDLESLTPSDDSSSVDLGSLANMPSADVVLGKQSSAENLDLEEEEGAAKPGSDEGIEIEAAPVEDELEELEAAPVAGTAGREAGARRQRPSKGAARGQEGKAPAKEKGEAAPPRGRAGAWAGGTLVGTLVGAGLCVALWVGGIEPPASWRGTVGTAAPPTTNGTTGPGPAVAAPTRFEDTRDLLKRGEFEKAKAALSQIDETRAEQLLARAEHRWLSYLQQEKGRNPAARLDPNADAVKQTLEELNRDPVKNLPDAIFLRGQIYEWTGNKAEAHKEYKAGFDQFKADVAERLRFETALLTLDLRTNPDTGAFLPRQRHPDERAALLAVFVLLQEPGVPANPPEEAGFSFWKAVKASREKNYEEALKALEEARARHDKQRFQKLRKAQNPISDPLEEIFLRACDELKRSWELEGRLRNPDYLAAEPKNRIKAVDDLLDKAGKTSQTRLLEELSGKLVKEKPEKPITNAAELVAVVNAERKATSEALVKLEGTVADMKKQVADLGGKLKEATELAQATTKQLDVAEGRAKTLQAAEKEYRSVLQGVSDAVGVKFSDPKTDLKPLLQGVRDAARVARMRDPTGTIRSLEAEVRTSRASLKERWAPARMLDFWLPVLESDRGRKDLAEAALLDADRVSRDPAATAVEQGKAELIRGLALRNGDRFAEAKPLLEKARASLAGAGGDWATRANDALREITDPASVYLSKADRLLAQGRAADAVTVLGQAAEALPAANRGPVLARRSLLALESARSRGPVGAGNPAVQRAREDAEKAAGAGLAEGHYVLGRIAEELGQFDQAVASYREAVKGTAAADEAGSRYRIALARVLLRARSSDARRAGPIGRMETPRGTGLPGTQRVSADFSVLLFTLLLQAPPGFPGGAPTADQKEAERLADEVLAQGDKVPFDVRAQALAVKGLYTRALNVYTAGLREKGLLAPGYANALLDLIAEHPALRRPETLLIPDPLEAERHYSAGLNFFFARNYAQAEREFLSAVQNDNADARYFYFLGMSRLALGQRDAYEDLDQGARLEWLGKPSRAAVSTALERVQGPMRQLVNAIRTRPIKDIPR
jgi:tetratricopeptide (TPR) repeat protein